MNRNSSPFILIKKVKRITKCELRRAQKGVAMKKRNKVLALMLSTAMVCTALTGCGDQQTVRKAEESSEEKTQQETGSASESVEDFNENVAESEELVPEEGASLILWMDNDDYNEKIVELWNAKYSDIPLAVENVGTTDARAKLELDGPAGLGCDVFVQAHDGVAIAASSGLILEMDYYTDYIKENFVTSAVEAVTYEGAVYAFPLSMKTIALFYNKALVDQPVTTWDEMREFAKEYNDPAQNKFAILWQAIEPYYAHGFLGGYGYEMFGENHDDKTKLDWDSTEALEGMKFYETLSEIYPVNSADATWDAMNSMFSAGEAPYVLTGPWSISDFEKAGIDFGVTCLPLLPNGQHPVTLSTVDTVCISSYTNYPDAAMLLAKFLTDEEAMALLYETKAEIPASITGQQFDFVVSDEHLKGVLEQSVYSLPMPYIPEMANVWAPYQKAFTAVWDKLQTPEDALKTAQEEFYSSIIQE